MDSSKSKSNKKRTKRKQKKRERPSFILVSAIVLFIVSVVVAVVVFISYMKKTADITAAYSDETAIDVAAPSHTKAPQNDNSPVPEDTDSPSLSEPTTVPEPTAEITPGASATPALTPSAAPTNSAAPAQTPEDYVFSLAELKEGVQYNLCGHSLKYGKSGDTYTITLDGSTKKISDCYALYGITFPSGEAGIIAGIFSEQDEIVTYSVTDGLSECYRHSNVHINGISGDCFVIGEFIDCFGTWGTSRTYSISEQLKLSATTGRMEVIGDYKSIELSVKHDISAKTPDGDSILLSAGTTVRMKYIRKGINNIACLYDSDGTQYLVERITAKNGYEVATPDGNLSEYTCFENMPYSG